MITWNTISDKTAFNIYYTSAYSSAHYSTQGVNEASAIGETNTYGGTGDSYTFQQGSTDSTYSNGGTYQYSNTSFYEIGNATGTVGNSTTSFQSVSVEVAGGLTYYSSAGTTIVNATFEDKHSSTISDTTYTASYSVSYPFPVYTLGTTTDATTTKVYTTSSQFSTSVKSYTTSSYGGSTYLTSSSKSVNTTGTSYVSTGENYWQNSTIYITAVSTVNYTGYTALPSTVSNPVDIGTVVSAEGHEWLWSATDTPTGGGSIDTDINFISDIATSFKQATIWPIYFSSSVQYYTYQGPTTITVNRAASTTAFSIDDFEQDFTSTDDTYDIVYTSGNNIERDTASAYGLNIVSVTHSFTDGIDSYSTVVNIETFDLATTLKVNSTTTSTVMVNCSGNYSTTTISVNTTATQGYTYESPLTYNDYIGSGGSTYAGGSSSFTSFMEATLQVLGFAMPQPVPFASMQPIEKVPKANGMYSPFSISQTAAIGTNINLTPTIYYPFASSVLPGVMAPLRLNTSVSQVDTNKTAVTTTTESYSYSYLSFGYPKSTGYTYTDSSAYTDVTTWSYAWGSSNLSYTKKQSYTSVSNSATVTAYSTSSHTGALNVEGDNGRDCYSAPTPSLVGSGFQAPTPVGGWAPFTTDKALLIYAPGGRAVTNYDTSGGSTTTLTVISQLTSASLSETVHVESMLPVFSTTAGDWPVTGFGAYEGQAYYYAPPP